MKVLVVGGGGREHAIIKKLKENKSVEKIWALPGNGGIALDAECHPVKATDIYGIVNFAKENKIDFAVVPILGVDVDFKIIGFGKGMYDRFYDTLKKKPYSIFVCRILNLATLKIGDSYDIVGDTIISVGIRKGNYDFLGNNWFCCRWNFIRRICISDNKKSIYLKTAHSFKTSKNQSNCNRKRS